MTTLRAHTINHMSRDAIIVLLIFASMPAIIIVAVVVKLWEVRKAQKWPQAKGKVIRSSVKSHKYEPGEMGHNFSDTDVTNEPDVQYEFKVGDEKFIGNRVTIGEKTAEWELEGILKKYPVGAEVTVFYDPDNPKKSVLERDLPMGIMAAGVGCLLAFFIGGPLGVAGTYFASEHWLKHNMANPARAPFAAAAGVFGLLVLLFAIAFQRRASQASRWPTTRGKIVASGAEQFLDRLQPDERYRRTAYKPSVQYAYEVNGHQFLGDRLVLGTTVSSNLSGLAKRGAAKYPVGMEVDVYYNPQSPGEAVLYPKAKIQWLPWIMAAIMLTLFWAVATGRMG